MHQLKMSAEFQISVQVLQATAIDSSDVFCSCLLQRQLAITNCNACSYHSKLVHRHLGVQFFVHSCIVVVTAIAVTNSLSNVDAVRKT